MKLEKTVSLEMTSEEINFVHALLQKECHELDKAYVKLKDVTPLSAEVLSALQTVESKISYVENLIERLEEYVITDQQFVVE